MSNTKPFLSVKGRWARCVARSGLDKVADSQTQGLAMMTFYAGFAACLEATTELGDLPEHEACRLLAALHHEMALVRGVAEQAMSGGTPS